MGITDIYQAPSAAHLLGTDDGGKDVLARLLYGAQVSIIVGFAAAFISLVIGGAIGLVAGYAGGGSARCSCASRTSSSSSPTWRCSSSSSPSCGAEPDEHHLRHRGARLDHDGSHRPRPDPHRPGARVRGEGAGGRRLGLPHPATPHRPAGHAADARPTRSSSSASRSSRSRPSPSSGSATPSGSAGARCSTSRSTAGP